MSKLKVAGIEGHSGLWLENYLLDRKQFVTLNDAQSETLTLDYGVPHTSCMGPSKDLDNCRRLFRFITSFKIVNDINCPKQLQDKLKTF